MYSKSRFSHDSLGIATNEILVISCVPRSILLNNLKTGIRKKKDCQLSLDYKLSLIIDIAIEKSVSSNFLSVFVDCINVFDCHLFITYRLRNLLLQEIDAALISVISFPAFAVDNLDVIINTREEIKKKLMVSASFRKHN